uniref:Alpha-1,3-glucosyltransferase n=1 Tax=Compsopogon caeruleus TaxID=31354 RepID=A0A7S1TDF2_9RHOD|mmetsp:Transcript_18501/g.38756  ORF Transcript_18501/g.38756 Transcript_18501/m.38756 type:complete len:546 (+) Transcript_18501:209-1846(+)
MVNHPNPVNMSPRRSFYWIVYSLVIATSIKLLLMPGYRSTDMEVHRYWMALTHSFPIHEWYTESNSSNWTLDYPPAFAGFQWLSAVPLYALGCADVVLDPTNAWLTSIDADAKDPYGTGDRFTIRYMRMTVIVGDILLVWGLYRVGRVGRSQSECPPLAAAVILLDAGLFIVDHIHFQYNGLVIGLLLLSISYLVEQRFVIAGSLLTWTLFMKHTLLSVVPAVGVLVLLNGYSRAERRTLWNIAKPIIHVCLAGLFTAITFFTPFLSQWRNVLSRLFPFGRGLLHSYWAPNAWALYLSLDLFLARTLGARKAIVGSATSGIIGSADPLRYLPNVSPLTAAILSLVSSTVVIGIAVWKRRVSNQLTMRSHEILHIVGYSSLCFFMFGWHVHEKAILLTLIPFICSAFLRPAMDEKGVTDSLAWIHPLPGRDLLLFAAVSYASLLPLLYFPAESGVKLSLCLMSILLIYNFLPDFDTSTSRKWNSVEMTYLGGLIVVECYTEVGGLHHYLFGRDFLHFLPLLLRSLYCAVGVSYIWVKSTISLLRSR